MKKKYIFMFLSFIGFFFVTNAQITDVEYIISEQEQSRLEQVIHVGGKTIVGGSNYNCKHASLYALEENGEKIWEIDFGEGNYSWVTDLYYSASDQMLIVAVRWSHGDDFGHPEDGPNIFGVDLNGEVKFETHLEMTDWNLSLLYGVISPVWLQPSFVTMNSDNEIMVTRAEHLFWLDNEGVLLDSIRYEGEMFAGIGRDNSTSIVGISHSKIIIMDNDGNIQVEQETGEALLNMVVSGNRVFATSNSTVFVYDYISNELFSNNSNAEIIYSRTITVDDAWIYLSGNAAQSDIPIIQKYNKFDLTFEESISFGQPGTIKDLFSNNNELFIAGQQIITEDWDEEFFKLNQSFVKSTPVFETPTFEGTDISLSNINIIQPAEIDYFDSLEYIYFYTYPYAIFEYDVTNEGNDTIYSFAIASNRYNTGFNCEYPRFYSYVNDVVIPPGATVTLKDSTHSSNAQYDSELKLKIFAPNHHFDGDTTNNFSIAADPLLLPIAMCDCIDELQFSIFPNPVSEQLNIFLKNENNSQDGSIRLVNLNGKVLEEIKILPYREQYNLSVEKYPAGIYFLQYIKASVVAGVEKVIIN